MSNPLLIEKGKTYLTRSGKKVIIHDIKLTNSAGNKVTYPVKGIIIDKEKPYRTRYCIWSIDGVSDVVWGQRACDDITQTYQP